MDEDGSCPTRVRVSYYIFLPGEKRYIGYYLYLCSRTNPLGSQLATYDKPEIISFDGSYSLKYNEWGPWITNKVLTRNSDGKKFKLAGNAPEPIIIHNGNIIIPDEYNILTVWKPDVTFTVYKLH